MFSSNQIFDVACELDNLVDVIRFGVRLSGNEHMFSRTDGRVSPAFMVDLNGRYCLGAGSMEPFRDRPGSEREAPEHWTDYVFDYDPEVIAMIVKQWVRKQPAPEPSGTNGTERLGVRVRCKESLPVDPDHLYCGLQNPWPCILVFEPYYLGYDK